MKNSPILSRLKNGLIVSCQSEPPEPLATPEMLTAMARSAVMGGAVGIRANLPANIRAIVKEVNVPVIGIYKKIYPDSEVFITPTIDEVRAVLEAGAQIVALDATRRQRPGSNDLAGLVQKIRSEYNTLLMADISDLDEALTAAKLGFDMIGTTLSGYTSYTKAKNSDGTPDFELISALSTELKGEVPVIAEGRIWHPEEAVRALDAGAYAVVVGTAITRPWEITGRFSRALNNRRDYADDPN